MKLHKLVRDIYIHMYFCRGSSLILQAMGPSFSNFLVWCLDISGGTRFFASFFFWQSHKTRMQYVSTVLDSPRNPWFVGPMGWHLHQKFFTKIVETKDQNGPKSQAGVVDYGHEPDDVGWCDNMALPLLFTFTSWGFFQVDTNFIAKAKKGECVECVECKVAGFYWAIKAVGSTNLHSVVVVQFCMVKAQQPKKNIHAPVSHLEIWSWTFTNSWWTWRVPKKHPWFLEKNEHLQPNCTSQLSICPLAMSLIFFHEPNFKNSC